MEKTKSNRCLLLVFIFLVFMFLLYIGYGIYFIGNGIYKTGYYDGKNEEWCTWMKEERGKSYEFCEVKR